MSEKILENLFIDKTEKTIREIKKELIHYGKGLAPEKPSFIVNQNATKQKIREELSNSFDKLAMGFLVIIGNTGDGKTHILHTLQDRFSAFDKIMVQHIYLRGEDVNLYKLILQNIDKVFLRKAIRTKLEGICESKDHEDRGTLEISEYLKISLPLAQILWNIAFADDLYVQLEAMNFLIGINQSDRFLDQFRDFKEEAFQVETIVFINSILESNGHYLVLLLDEFEHVMSWRDQVQQRRFFRNIKELMDRSGSLTNICLFFAATEIYKGEFSDKLTGIIESVDPALYERIEGAKTVLESVTSDQIIKELIENIYSLSMRLGNISCKPEDIFHSVKEKIVGNYKINYRRICQLIMATIKEFSDQEPQSEEKVKVDTGPLQNDFNQQFEKLIRNYSSEWEEFSGKNQKTIIVECVSEMMTLLDYKVSELNKRDGYMVIGKDEIKQFVYIAHTTKTENDSFIKDKFRTALDMAKKYTPGNVAYFLFPIESCTKEYQDQLIEYSPGEVVVIGLERADYIDLQLLLEKKISLKSRRGLAEDFASKFGMIVR